jgi:serine/threonine protein kinase
MALQPGDILNQRYRIVEIVAHGGMSSIYRAHDEILGVDVAIKENEVINQESTRQFQKEASILAGVRHPALPRVTDHFTVDQHQQYLVMDFIPGEDLRQRADRLGGIPAGEAVAVAVTICDALTVLHNAVPPIIHRDIKPGNIKISPQGQVFLVDFGLAKSSPIGETTTFGARALTPGYAPPEQYGQGTLPQSDIYALGATLYAVLAQSLPEDGLSRFMGNLQLTPLRRHNQAVPPALAAAIEKAMAVRVEDRYPTAEAMKQALLAACPPADLRSNNPQPKTPVLLSGPSRKPGLPKIKSPGLRRLLSLAGVVAILAGGFFILSRPPLSRPASSTPTPTLNITTPMPTAAAVVLETKVSTARPQPTIAVSEPVASPSASTGLPSDGSQNARIAYVSDRSGMPQIYIYQDEANPGLPLTDFPDGACQPDWSPDGTKIVFISPCPKRQEQYANASMFILNTDGSGLRVLQTLPGGDFEPAWSPDGKDIAFTSLREKTPHIFLYHLADDSVKRLSPPSASDRRAAWSPDGDWIAFESLRIGETWIWKMDRNGENVAEVSPVAGSYQTSPAWSPDGTIMYYSKGVSLPQLAARTLNDTTSQEVLISEVIRPVWDAAVSPDGQRILFESLQGDTVNLYWMPRSGSAMHRLLSQTGSDYDAAWEPTYLYGQN